MATVCLLVSVHTAQHSSCDHQTALHFDGTVLQLTVHRGARALGANGEKWGQLMINLPGAGRRARVLSVRVYSPPTRKQTRQARQVVSRNGITNQNIKQSGRAPLHVHKSTKQSASLACSLASLFCGFAYVRFVVRVAGRTVAGAVAGTAAAAAAAATVTGAG